MPVDYGDLEEWLPLIRGEYEDLPDLRLTESQVQELWELDAPVAAALLSALVATGILNRTHEGAYVRADAHVR